MSRERVRQIESCVKRRLREFLEEHPEVARRFLERIRTGHASPNS